MLFNPQSEIEKIAFSPELEDLLAQARAHTTKVANGTEGVQDYEDLHQRAATAQAKAAFASQGLRDALQKKEAERQQKVAIVLHMLGVGSRLCS